MSDTQADLAFYLYDTDKSGTLEFEEFWSFVSEAYFGQDQPKIFLKRAFDAFDADKNGTLDQTEIETYFTVAGLENPCELAASLLEEYHGEAVTFEQLYHHFYPE
jgi:Ca2+-binding EF-hand superfamily protein